MNLKYKNDNEIEIEKILNYEEYYFFNQNLLTEQERDILHNKLHCCLSYTIRRIKYYPLNCICQYCKNIFIFNEGGYVICSACKNILDDEINEFEEYIINKYEDIKNKYNNGIFTRVRLILFCERERILNKKFTPCAFFHYMFSNKINIGIYNLYKISRTLKYNYERIHRYDEYKNSTNFDFLKGDNGIGATDKKMIKALEYCANIMPEFFVEYYYKYL